MGDGRRESTLDAGYDRGSDFGLNGVFSERWGLRHSLTQNRRNPALIFRYFSFICPGHGLVHRLKFSVLLKIS